MAKLNAPLFSFGASGAIAKALVYFPWKGLNVVRSWVCPANPKSDAQVEQRGWMTEAVDKIHVAMADVTYPFLTIDRSAWSLLGSLFATPRTWFNTIVKQWIDGRVSEGSCCIFSGGQVTEDSTQLTLELHITASIGAEPTTGSLFYGKSKSSMLSSIVTTVADLATGQVITGLVNGTKYFMQYRPSTVGYVGQNSGIYIGTPHA